jgi:hypothetical protein
MFDSTSDNPNERNWRTIQSTMGYNLHKQLHSVVIQGWIR